MLWGGSRSFLQLLQGEIHTAVDPWVWPALPILLTKWKTTGYVTSSDFAPGPFPFSLSS